MTTNYDTFARFYDPVMGDRQDVIEIIQALINHHHPTAKTILELGCGTGSLLAGLAPHYSVSGIDLSSQMLKIAQQKLPKSIFYNENITSFTPNITYDIVICMFDTINHLTRFSDWRKLIANAYTCLNPNGLFIFDMNTIGRMKALTAIPNYTQDFDGNTMDMQIEPVSNHEVEWHVTIQEPHSDNTIQVYEEHVREVSFPLAQVKPELQSRFTILDAFDSDHAAPSDRSDRVYYACHKHPANA